MTVVVYTSPGCRQCVFTERALDTAGIEYSTVDLSESEEALEKVKALGYQQAPVVVTSDGRHWSGLQPDKISDLVAA